MKSGWLPPRLWKDFIKFRYLLNDGFPKHPLAILFCLLSLPTPLIRLPLFSQRPFFFLFLPSQFSSYVKLVLHLVSPWWTMICEETSSQAPSYDSPRAEPSPKLCPATYSLTGVKCRATSVANKSHLRFRVVSISTAYVIEAQYGW